MQSLDHGLLNLPLAKRGPSLDSQIDAYKAKQAAIAKDKRDVAIATRRDDKAAAKVALAELIAAPGVLDANAVRLNVTRKQLLVALTDWAKWRPARVIKARAEWMSV